eukprot:Gregarina_sp_Poly_1__948@NODE_122_length_13497_cov_184_110052_g109_i0_p1_GENE_NODE_122_length_13497_cov_184_110052_g109_i0NODE_122_length_13497_cov_184_110052_g109_i0_p1_ORF_typecomplete_len2401_score373_88HEAT_EZ/PF13513_6/4e03HEAT_EZ/PF13513_6/87HEAT_EZ/PF13513_6/0_00059HEAT_EZ/PF13513_6/0_0017HEAT_EZ/PF13513_6/3_8e05HEAT_EZ/PF13513_6/0_87HEAT_EZ/PF13513_6/0_0013HEAT_EZ/PF13513_6/2_6e02HEAT_EZ/PF13513_6/3_2e02HEAT_EZ/PF13513_6/81HEAT_EZ/PF13513_6/2_2e02HEAT_EZ/PF13513_6/0_63HEAT_EZ/PF13513_6/9
MLSPLSLSIDDQWLLFLLTEHLSGILKSKEEQKCTAVLNVLHSFRPMPLLERQLAAEIGILISSAKATVQIQPRCWILDAIAILCDKCKFTLQNNQMETISVMLNNDPNDEPRKRLLQIQIVAAPPQSKLIESWQKISPQQRSEALWTLLQRRGSNIDSKNSSDLQREIQWCKEQISNSKDKIALRLHSRRCLCIILRCDLDFGFEVENIAETVEHSKVILGDSGVNSGETAQALLDTIALLVRRDWPFLSGISQDFDHLASSLCASDSPTLSSSDSLPSAITMSLLTVVHYLFSQSRQADRPMLSVSKNMLWTLNFTKGMRRHCLSGLAFLMSETCLHERFSNETIRLCVSILCASNARRDVPAFLGVDALNFAFLLKLHPRAATRSTKPMRSLKKWTRRMEPFPPTSSLAATIVGVARSHNNLVLKAVLPHLFSLSHSFFKRWEDRQTASGSSDFRTFSCDWRDALVQVIKTGFIPMLDVNELRSIERKSAQTETETVNREARSSAPKAKAAKMTPAQAKLLNMKKAEPPSRAEIAGPKMLEVKEQTARNLENVCGCLSLASLHWPDLVASELSELVPRILALMPVTFVALPVYTMCDRLCQAFVEVQAVPERRRISLCLFLMAGSKLPVSTAEAICASLSENQVLSSEASHFVLPIISFLLSPQAASHVSLVAVHRAASVLSHQLKLGASMNANEVLESVRSIITLRPNLLSLCGSILSNVPKTADFKPHQHLNPITEFLESDNMDFRRHILRIICDKVDPPEALSGEGLQHFCFRIYAVSKDPFDEPCRNTAETIMQKPNFLFIPEFVQNEAQFIQTAIAMFATPSIGFSKLAANCLAVRFEHSPERALEQIIRSWDNQYALKPKTTTLLQIQGFEMRPEDLETLKSQLKKDEDGRIAAPQGRYGLIEALGSFAGMPGLPLASVKLISRFIITQALSTEWIEEELFCRIEQLASYLCASNLKAAESHVDFLKDHLLPLSKNEYSRSVCLLMLGLQCKYVSQDEPRLTQVEQVLDTELLMAANALRIKKAASKSLAHVLSPLFKAGALDRDAIFAKFKKSAIEMKDVRVRVGGALGVAAVIKALGSLFLRDCNLVPELATVCSARKETYSRHGGFLCFEAILDACGRVVETQAPQILPIVLSGFSDMQAVVREAAAIVARKLMGCLSGHGLKAILPELLKVAAESTNWRSKVGSIELLGHVASVSPSHLVSVLNQVIPVLCENAHDSHKEVKAMASQAIRTLVCVITNPQLKTLEKNLLQCLIDASDKNVHSFLEELMSLEFRHYLDGSCLAFLIPIVERALRGPRADTRLKAANILAVLPFVCMQRDTTLAPFVKPLITQLIANLNDPLPEVRQSAAKCLGLLTETLGGATYQETIPFLIRSLKSSQSSVERSGAANALVEIFHALGTEVLEDHLGDVLKQADSNPSPGVREGFIGLFVYMPLIFGSDFDKFVPQVLPVLLRALSSEEDPVRDIAFRASQIFVNQYGSSHTPLLLQPLERALFAPHVEVRLRAVSLLGLLVEKILKGVEDSNAEGGQLMQLEILSLERRAYILSSLYLARSDEEADVRHAAASTWKTVVQNTPKTVRELLPILTKRLLDLLSTRDVIKEGVAQRCMEELVVKHGEKLVPEVMSTFVETLKDPRQTQTRGVFIGLEALVGYAPRSLLKQYLTQLTPLIKEALKTCAEDSSRKQIINVINLLAAKGDDSAPGNKAKAGPSTNVKFFYPFLDELFLPPVFDLGQVTDKRLGALKTIEMFLVSQTTVMLEEIFKRCSQDPVDLSRVFAMGLLQSIPTENVGIVHLWEKILAVLHRGFFNTFPTSPYFSNIRDPIGFRTEIKDSLVKVITAFPAELRPEAVSSVADLLAKNRATIDGGATGWTKLLSLTDPKMNVDCCDVSTMQDIMSRFPSAAVQNPESQSISRAFAFLLAGAFFSAPSPDLRSEAMPVFHLVGLPLLTETHPESLNVGADTMGTLVKALDREGLISLGPALHEILLSATTPPAGQVEQREYLLPGLARKTILENVALVLQASLLYGPLPAKEAAATAFLTTVRAADASVLSVLAVKAVGPLIRVFADRVPGSVKVQALQTLAATLGKTEQALRPLVSQLQSTFIKCLLDGNAEDLRLLAASALKQLAPLAGARVDLLVKELIKLLTTSESPRPVMDAIAAVYEVGVDNVTVPTRDAAWNSLVNFDHHGDIVTIDGAGQAIGVMLNTSDKTYVQMVWQCDILSRVSQPSIAVGVKFFIHYKENYAWLKDQNLLDPLLDLAVEAASAPSPALASLLAELIPALKSRPESVSRICWSLGAHLDSISKDEDPSSAQEFLVGLNNLASSLEIQREVRIYLAKCLAGLLRCPALKVQTEQVLTSLLKNGKINDLLMAKADPNIKLVVDQYQALSR